MHLEIINKNDFKESLKAAWDETLAHPEGHYTFATARFNRELTSEDINLANDLMSELAEEVIPEYYMSEIVVVENSDQEDCDENEWEWRLWCRPFA